MPGRMETRGQAALAARVSSVPVTSAAGTTGETTAATGGTTSGTMNPPVDPPPKITVMDGEERREVSVTTLITGVASQVDIAFQFCCEDVENTANFEVEGASDEELARVRRHARHKAIVFVMKRFLGGDNETVKKHFDDHGFFKYESMLAFMNQLDLAGGQPYPYPSSTTVANFYLVVQRTADGPELLDAMDDEKGSDNGDHEAPSVHSNQPGGGKRALSADGRGRSNSPPKRQARSEDTKVERKDVFGRAPRRTVVSTQSVYVFSVEYVEEGQVKTPNGGWTSGICKKMYSRIVPLIEEIVTSLRDRAISEDTKTRGMMLEASSADKDDACCATPSRR